MLHCNTIKFNDGRKQGEQIPHEEKILSIFEPPTLWINFGPAGDTKELGVKVCILEVTWRFILHHEVMEKQTDDKIAVKMVDFREESVSQFICRSSR